MAEMRDFLGRITVETGQLLMMVELVNQLVDVWQGWMMFSDQSNFESINRNFCFKGNFYVTGQKNVCIGSDDTASVITRRYKISTISIH